MKNVSNIAEYHARGGWITADVPFTFNIDDVAEVKPRYFQFKDEPPIAVIQFIFEHGDSINLVFDSEEERDYNYETLMQEKRKRSMRVINGKSENKE